MATRSDLLLHPVRLRIVLAAVGDEVTTADISERLPDVPQATLYRHVAILTRAGVLDVVSERQTRGAVEKTLTVNADRARLGPEDAKGMSPDDHLEAFTVFVGALIDTYGRYLKTPGAQPANDGVSYRQARLWLTDSELEELWAELTEVLGPYVDRERTPERTTRLMSTIFMPEPTPGRSSGSDHETT